jgi:hypothetical protein
MLLVGIPEDRFSMASRATNFFAWYLRSRRWWNSRLRGSFRCLIGWHGLRAAALRYSGFLAQRAPGQANDKPTQ